MSKTVKIYRGFVRKGWAVWMRFISALFILPASFGLTCVLISFFKSFPASYIPFFLGVLAYTLVYPVFSKPFVSYVIAHELSHVIGIWLSRGKVHSVKIGKGGGHVKTNKTSVWVALLPYFFPFYTLIVLGIYYILSIVWDLSRFFSLMVFLLGITWAFHLWMTQYIIRQKQPDIKYSGIFFSGVIIFTVNLVILLIILAIISPDAAFNRLFKSSCNNIQTSYLWILRKLI